MEIKREISRYVLVDGLTQEGKLVSQRDNLARLLQNYGGKPVRITIEFLDTKPTVSQFEYLYGCIYKTMQLWWYDLTGELRSIESIDIEMKTKCFFHDKITPDMWACSAVPQSKAGARKGRLAAYIDRVLAEAATWGLYIPAPNEEAPEGIAFVPTAAQYYKSHLTPQF